MEFIMPNEVQANQTDVSVQDMIKYIHKGWEVYFNSVPPNKESIWILISYWAIKTNWGSNVYNYNVGNLRSEDNDGYDYMFRPSCMFLNETEAESFKKQNPGKVSITSYKDAKNNVIVWFLPDHKLSRFRAYQNICEGVVDYFCHLARCLSDSWAAIQTADVDAVGEALRGAGLASEPLRDAFGNGFVDVLQKYMKACENIDFDYDSLSVLTEDEKQQIKNLIGLSLIGEENG